MTVVTRRRTSVGQSVPEQRESALEAFWSLSAAELLQNLDAFPTGLSASERQRRLAKYGPNVTHEHRRLPAWRMLAAQFKSPITILLAGAAALSLALGEATDGGIILIILAASAGLSIVQEHRASGAIDRLLAVLQSSATVLVDNEPTDVPLDSVVPGDVVVLNAGDAVPGDGQILESKNLYVDEAALTGESFPADKQAGIAAADAPIPERTNAVFLGTHVISGTATLLVATTGQRTAFGLISSALTRKPPETEFEHGIRRFGGLLLEVALALALVIFAVNIEFGRPLLDSLLFTLALAIGLTPQLLPAIMSVTLAQGAARMARRRVIVRRLASIEDLGGMTILCTDKTGTLTEGVARFEGVVDVSGSQSDKGLLYAGLNAALETGYNNPIDEAIRRSSRVDLSGIKKLDELPYDFSRKRLSVAVSQNDERLLITKGAVENTLAVCTSVEQSEGKVSPIGTFRPAILKQFEAYSRQGFRCLGVAYRRISSDGHVDLLDERDMTYLGLLLLADPPKQGVVDSLRRINDLGIELKLITGDNRHVAARIAGEVGLEAESMITGADLRHLSDAALVLRAEHASIFAEVDPNQKERIILALKKKGRAVGYLGDGINDAAALHAADVGISVESAVDVTKESADIVLLEKDLAVLVDGVREGRTAFANTLKYVFITTSASFGNMFSMAGASLFTDFLPMLPKQILLLNVLTDLPAMAIASDRLDPELVQRPRNWDVRAIQRFMIAFGLISSVFDFVTFGSLLALHVPPSQFRTAWFLESALSELLILLVIRTRRPLFRSPIGRGLLAASAVVAVTTITLPFVPGSSVLGFAPMTMPLTALVAGILAAYVVTSEFAKRWFFGRVHP